jgi:hypothetical protein
VSRVDPEPNSTDPNSTDPNSTEPNIARPKNSASSGTAELACDVCGRLPHPHPVRLTLAKVAAAFPIELLVHAVVVGLDMPFAVKVAVLALTATVLLIWVIEPSTMRVLREWLHAPAVRARRRLDAAPALWRVRTTVDDEPGTLERLAHEFARLDANILTVHVHHDAGSAVDEFVLATPASVGGDELVAAAEAAGGYDAHAWATTALALADGQTKALSLATRVLADPAELPLAVAELLGARVVTGRLSVPDVRAAGPEGAGTLLKIPSPWSGAFLFTRPDEPFTPAERARAHRLAELAERAVLVASGRRVAASTATDLCAAGIAG